MPYIFLLRYCRAASHTHLYSRGLRKKSGVFFVERGETLQKMKF